MMHAASNKQINYNFCFDHRYYIATVEDEPGSRHLFRIPFVFTPLLRQPECLSCVEHENTTSPCNYNKAHLSPDFSYFVLECLGPGLPSTYLFSTMGNEVSYVPQNCSIELLTIVLNILLEIGNYDVQCSIV